MPKVYRHVYFLLFFMPRLFVGTYLSDCRPSLKARYRYTSLICFDIGTLDERPYPAIA